MFPESFLAIGLEEEDGDIVSQAYSEGEYDTGFVSNEDNKDSYIMNEENPALNYRINCFSFVFNDPEALK